MSPLGIAVSQKHNHSLSPSQKNGKTTESVYALDKIDEYGRNWFLHLQRMPPNRIPLKSYHYRPQGRRTIGRPKKSWREHLQLWRRNGSKEPIFDVYDDLRMPGKRQR
jgi:hypothetical protein